MHILVLFQNESLTILTSISYTLDIYPLAFAEYVTKNSKNTFAIAEVFILPDSNYFVPDINLTPEQFMNLSFAARTAAKLIHLEYNADSYLAAMRQDKKFNLPQQDPHHLLVIRHNNEVKRHRLEAAEQLILSELFKGRRRSARLCQKYWTKMRIWRRKLRKSYKIGSLVG